MGIAINIPADEHDQQTKPWYRYGWPWFLISIPFVSIALGAMMLYLALSANNSLVVDDYYKEGKSINLRIERDRVASLLGLQAKLRPSEEGLILEVSQKTPALPDSLQADASAASLGFQWPQTLELKWVHVTQAERDGEATLVALGGDRYLALGVALPEFGKYRIHVQPTGEASWRLVSKLVGLEDAPMLTIPAQLPKAVFNQSRFE